VLDSVCLAVPFTPYRYGLAVFPLTPRPRLRRRTGFTPVRLRKNCSRSEFRYVVSGVPEYKIISALPDAQPTR
jgi:hypothetical protein